MKQFLAAATIALCLLFAGPTQAETNLGSSYTFSTPIGSETMEKSNYHSVRKVLSASQFIDKAVKYTPLAPTPFGVFANVAAKVVKGGIYAEDWRHTDREIEQRIREVLSSPKLANAPEYPELYIQFEKYVRSSLQRWVPDRDYPQIGYLPKELLYDRSLGEKDLHKYWPEATKKEIDRYTALTFDELVLNYELIWNDLCIKK